MSDLKVSELLAQRAELIDAVRHYSGNEASGYREIARLNEKIVDASAREHASLTLEVAQLKQRVAELEEALRPFAAVKMTGERRRDDTASILHARAALKESPHVR